MQKYCSSRLNNNVIANKFISQQQSQKIAIKNALEISSFS